MTVVTQTPSNELHDNIACMFFLKTTVSSRRQATFFRKVAFRPDASPLSGHITGSGGNGGSKCGADPPTTPLLRLRNQKPAPRLDGRQLFFEK